MHGLSFVRHRTSSGCAPQTTPLQSACNPNRPKRVQGKKLCGNVFLRCLRARQL